jgi:hypothetical protein
MPEILEKVAAKRLLQGVWPAPAELAGNDWHHI